MRAETREVLVKKIIYIADDGKEFEDEEQCMQHEDDNLVNSLRYYDRRFREAGDPVECTYVDLPDEESVKRFRCICKLYDVYDDGVENPGCYAYIEGEWVNMNEAIERVSGGALRESTR